MTSPDIFPAFRRIAAIASQREALEARHDREIRRLRKIGAKQLVRALRPLALQPRITIVDEITETFAVWPMGLFLGCAVSTPPGRPSDPWFVVVHFRPILKSGRLSATRGRRTFRVTTLADMAKRLNVAGEYAAKGAKA